jgi:hypothetical protein
MLVTDYLGIQEINRLFQNKARYYRKKTPVLARRVRCSEIGSTLITYIADLNDALGYKIETDCILSTDMVIVRNITELHDAEGNPLYDKENKPIYNEYAMPLFTFEKNYGNFEQLAEDFDQQFYKKFSIKAIEIDDEVISILYQYGKSDHTLPTEIRIKTNWGYELLEHGGLLTDTHYAISKREYQKTYMVIDDNNTPTNQENSEAKSNTIRLSFK